MELLEAIILGIVQGATEFLPVSSSGHLVLVSWWLDLKTPPLIYAVMVHLGTTLAILFYFWNDWWNLLRASIRALRIRRFDLDTDPDLRLMALLTAGTIPAGIIGLLLADYFDKLFSTPALVSINLLATAALLVYGEWAMRRAAQISDGIAVDDLDITWKDALIVGFAQALAILPGISRSGSTIAAGMSRGFSRHEATRFSFLLATPIILAAGLMQLLEVLTSDLKLNDGLGLALLTGFLSAFVIGYLSIVLLLNLVRRNGFYGFAAYCVAFGLLSLGAVMVRG